MPEQLWVALLPLLEFFQRGGPVMLALLGVAVILWSLIFERYWFFLVVFPRRARVALDDWRARSERRSWRAHRIREAVISEMRGQLELTLPVIATLVAICPLLGLLGTVTGMVEVFDVMAIKGTSDARSMAAGVSRATLPTMAGMVLALPGLFFISRCRTRAERLLEWLGDSLTFADLDPREATQ